MTIDGKFSNDMFTERLSTSMQPVLASCFNDLDIPKLVKMADCTMVVERLFSSMVARVSQISHASTYDLAKPKAQIAKLLATVATVHLRHFADSPRHMYCRDRHHSCPHLKTANLGWYHVDAGDEAQRCVLTCPFKFSRADRHCLDRGVLPQAKKLLRNRNLWIGVPLHGHWFKTTIPLDLRGYSTSMIAASPSPSKDFTHLLLPTICLALTRTLSSPLRKLLAEYPGLTKPHFPTPHCTMILFITPKQLAALAFARHPTTLMSTRWLSGSTTTLHAAEDLENWTNHLSLVPLGINSVLESEIDCPAAELVFGATVRITCATEDPTNLLHSP
nr:unnamed protein product [Spirometra erinaceieuropaei]